MGWSGRRGGGWGGWARFDGLTCCAACLGTIVSFLRFTKVTILWQSMEGTIPAIEIAAKMA